MSNPNFDAPVELDFCCGRPGKCPKFTKQPDGSMVITDPEAMGTAEIRLAPEQAAILRDWLAAEFG